MRSNSGLGKSSNNHRDPTIKEHEEASRHREKAGRKSEAHGGDQEPAGSDTAGRRQSPEAGPIDKS